MGLAQLTVALGGPMAWCEVMSPGCVLIGPCTWVVVRAVSGKVAAWEAPISVSSPLLGAESVVGVGPHTYGSQAVAAMIKPVPGASAYYSGALSDESLEKRRLGIACQTLTRSFPETMQQLDSAHRSHGVICKV